MDRTKMIMTRVKEHYDEACSLGYEVVGVFLQGSQNYNLDEYSDIYMSDIDTKAIILPSFDDIVLGKSPVSHTHVRANNEHIDIKDIRVMFEMFKKQNYAYLEILFTDFYIVNPKYSNLVNILLNKNEDIAHLHFNQALRCLAGMSMEKYKALEHPYPATLPKIEKYGYDPKQLHHIIRINEIIKRYGTGTPFKQCLKPENPQDLMEIKKGKYNLETARELAKSYDSDTHNFLNTHKESEEIINKDTVDFLNTLKVAFIKQFLKEELQFDH